MSEQIQADGGGEFRDEFQEGLECDETSVWKVADYDTAWRHQTGGWTLQAGLPSSGRGNRAEYVG